jgi:DNA-damage-inducible protein J
MTDCIIRSRIDPHVKAEAVHVFEHMGLTLSEAIRIFLYQSIAEQCIPFSINLPNATTRAELEAIKRGEGLEKTSLSQLKKDWVKHARNNKRQKV